MHRRHAIVVRAFLLAGPLALALAAPGACYNFGGYSLLPVDEVADAGEEDASIATCTPPTPEGVCGTIPQCGCATDQACDVAGVNGATACFPDKGLAAGAACSGLFEGCGTGLTCVNGACKRFCKSTRGCEREGLCFQVMYQADAGGIGVAGMKVCTDQCDYMNPELVCGAGAACYPHGAADTGYSECMAAGTSTTDCTINEDCAAGLACGGDKRCHPWCRYGVPIDCPPPQFCIAVKAGQTPVFYYLGDVAYGVCK